MKTERTFSLSQKCKVLTFCLGEKTKAFMPTSFLARAAVTLLLAVITTATAWADSWPSYITNVVLVGGTESEAQSAKSGYSGYTWCSQRLNEGKDIIYIGYKTSNSADTNGDYITDFIIIDAGSGTEGHNPPYSLTFQGRTYYRCPAAGGDYFVNSNHGNLTSQATNGWNMYLYYTKNSFDDKRAVSSINITKGEDTKSGSIDCYYKNGTLHEADISLNRGVSGTPFVYMHINTTTKVNRPNPEPTTNSGLTYNGSPLKLISSNYTNYNSGTVYYRVGSSGSYTSDVNNVTATDAGQYYVWYYSGESYYGNSSVDYAHTMTATIAKSPNSGLTVSCSNYLEGTAPVPSLVGNNLSTGTITYKYNTSQNGEYTTTVPTEPGTYWVKATIAADNNCFEYTTAPVSFTITYNWKLHNSGDTEDDAYVISTTTDLKYLAIWVNLGNNFEGKFFKLGDNIALDKSKENNFTPIGNSTYSFTGTFDGQGHTISGLNINKPDKDNVGLFGNTEEATIKNLIVDNSTINGKMSTGAIVGHSGNFVTVTNCRVTNSVTVSGTSQVGGITGVSSTVSGCVSAAAVSGSSFVGGIIGNGNFSSIANNLYTGTSINCPDIYKGAIVGEINGYTTLTANYYTADLSYKATANNNDINGACRAVVINTVDGVTVTPTGDATVYNVSGITAYTDNSGMLYSDGTTETLYAGATEEVNLDITYGIDGFSVLGYTDGVGSPATDLTLVSDNTYTLTMTADAPTVTPVTQNLWGVSSTHDGSTADKAYIITTTEGLDLLASKVNSGTNYEGKFFELGADITYDKTKENNFTTIGGREGGTAHWFHGTFDGKGHTISGINISNTSGEYQAIFGFVNGTIKNLVVSDCHIEAHQYIGGIAVILQTLQGSIENCHVLSDVTLKGYRIIGGIAAENDYANIKGCTCAATITGTKYDGTNTNHLGGITGYTSALSGETPTLKDNLFTGTISGDLGYAVGAIIGENSSNGTTLTNNFHTCSGIGGVNGSDTNGATFAYEYPAANAAIGAAVSTYAAGTEYEGITVYENGQAYNGKFYSPNPWGGNGTEEDPFVICDTAGLDLLASNVNSGNGYAGKYFELGADITYDGSENNFTPIGDNYHRFSGHFDGKGHKVSGININQPSGFSAGLFGFIESGSVKNLTLTNSTIIGNNPVSGIVAYADGTTIENCHVASDVTINGTDNVGAIAGFMYNSTVGGCTSAATVSGTQFVGGIVGDNNNTTIQDCLYTGTSVTASSTLVGAIVGYNEGGDAKLTNNYHTCSSMGGVGGVDSSDVDGAQFAVSSETMPDDFGDVTKTYGESTYIGVKTYGSNGLEYGSLYYFCGGTEKHPYVIRTTAELDKLASDVNSGNVYAGKYFELGADITYDGSENNFTPIGDNYHRFSGHFDGKGHKVSGININQPSGFSAGLFGFIESGSVKNLTLTNSTIIGYNPVSGIVGSANGTTIENCHVASDVTINGTADNVGAIAGYLYTSTVRGCTSAATVSGTQFVGGIVGVNNSSTIQDCLYTGTSVTASGTTVGTIVGYNEGGDAKLTNNYHTCSGMGGVGGVDSKDKDGATIAYELAAANAAMGAVGSTYGTGDYTGITAYENGLAYNGKYYCPSLWGGSGTEADPYVIYNTAGMDKLANDVNGGNDYQDTYFVLGNDIVYAPDVLTLDLDGDGNNDSNYMPLGNNGSPFMGNFDGQGHTISGISVNANGMDYIGVFGFNDGTVKNLTFSDCLFAGSQRIGAIAGFNRGTVENCHVAAYVSVTGNNGVGGVVGNNEGSVLGCTSAAALSTKEYADYFGGIAGSNAGTLTDNLFTGTIDKMPNSSLSIGAITGYNDTEYGTLTNNFHTCSGMGGVGNSNDATNTDQDGAQIAVARSTQPDASIIGEEKKTYGGTDYTGITAYEHGLYYNGQYYYRDPSIVYWAGSGTEDDPYIIINTAGLDKLASDVSGGNRYKDTYFELGADITYDGSENNFTPIGQDGYWFCGTFDGKGHTVSGIRISDTNGIFKAIFGYVYGTIKNLVVSDCSIEARQGIGGIVGYLFGGIIENCHVDSEVTLTGNRYIGGIAANLEGGTVIGCTSAATITGTTVGGGKAYFLGGISGYASGNGEDSPTLTDNLFTGTISGNLYDYIGAIVGKNNSTGTTLTNNYHTCSGLGGVGDDGIVIGSDEDGKAEFAVSSTTEPDEATIGTAGTPYAAGETYQGITPYTNGLFYNGLYYYKDPNTVAWTGKGTETDPYVIRTTAELDLLASRVNSDNKYRGKYFELGADITYDGSENNFTPIGENGYSFYGTFDGKGHTISGIRISDKDGTHKAIFGRVGGTVKNLVVSDCSIEGNIYVGGIVGLLYGTIENCHVLSNVTLTGYMLIGGIAGDLEGGTIIGCTSAARITGTKDGGNNARYLGGIAGLAFEYGEHSPTLTDNLFTGTISGDLDESIGAIVGGNDSDETTLTNNYHTCSGMGGVGNEDDAIGSDEAGKAEFAVSSTTKPDAATIGTAGTPYAEDETYQGITPYTHGLFYGGRYYYVSIWGGSGTEDDPYVIYNTAGLNKLASDVNDGNKYDGKYFELGADITYNKTKENNFTPIGNIDKGFYGTFDGKGHTISGIRISETNGTYKAIFGRIGGTVKNLVVSDCHIEARQDIGGIVAELFGTIENCHVLSDVTLTGYTYVGGITANIERGTIIGCTSAATITGTRPGGNAYSLGGIASFASEYAGDTSTLIDNLFTGTISGNLGEFIGAIVGENNSDGTTLTNNYYTCSGLGGVGDAGSTTGSDVAGALFAVSSNTKPDEATIGTAGTPYAEDETYQGITPYSKGLYYDGRYYWHEAFLRGDANGDGQVTITDAVAVVNYILGNPSENFNKAAANVNGDTDEHGEPVISITDAVGVVNIILNSAASTPAFTAPALTAPEDDDASPVDPE